jgi:hypothetical protein
MSLANLQKRAPSPRPQAITVDEFIDQAELYAQGHKVIYHLPVNKLPPMCGEEKSLKRATFTLGENAISQLSQLSDQTGIAKSRLIRIWLAEQQTLDVPLRYLTSTTK